MVLGTVVDLSVLSYPMLVIMKEQGADVGRGGALPSDVGRGGAYPQTSGEAEPAPRCRERWSQPPDVGRGGAYPQMSGEAEPALRGRAMRSQPSAVWARSVVVFLSVWKHQRLMVINSTSLGTPVLGPRHSSTILQEHTKAKRRYQ